MVPPPASTLYPPQHPSANSPTLRLSNKSKSRKAEKPKSQQTGKLASWHQPPKAGEPPRNAAKTSHLPPLRPLSFTLHHTCPFPSLLLPPGKPRRPVCARTHSTTRTVPAAHLPALTALCSEYTLQSLQTAITLHPYTHPAPARNVHTSSHPAPAEPVPANFPTNRQADKLASTPCNAAKRPTLAYPAGKPSACCARLHPAPALAVSSSPYPGVNQETTYCTRGTRPPQRQPPPAEPPHHAPAPPASANVHTSSHPLP